MKAERRKVLTYLGAGAASLAFPAVRAQDWPGKPVKLVIGYSTGGATDATARLVGRQLEASLGQPIVYEYKPGAGASLGAEFVARAAPDGYTIGLTDTGPMSIMPNLRKLTYDPVKDFTPLSYVCETGLVVLVHPSVPARNLGELIALLKASPDKYNYASSGVGSVHHLAGELFKIKAGVKAMHVPYRGAGPALTDLIAGQIPIMFATIGPALPMIATEKARALGVTSAKRSSALPEVPTLAEQGLTGYDASLKFSLVAPAGLPAPIAARLQSDLKRIVSDPELAKALQKLGNDDIGPRTPKEVTEITGSDLKKWGAVIQEAGITLDS
jgi:tripartite-type tricarboxylate transporter receptor subunit TctC